MAPMTVERLLAELDKLKRQTDEAQHVPSLYDSRLARIIRELRERGLDADRVAATTALADALRRGIITAHVATHVHRRLGLVA